ncbi:hypothetical protein BpHYR1_001328 [Brachionus plicatilis]|uniref:Uncharacterized protein n=1 Tax=Brachionus plicatilis TaxID=10195 RepID=A0A3M7Q3I3_BRAPC|nr:hypothetical protein BpHYR1_001328 [Brachionus plicatilis]
MSEEPKTQSSESFLGNPDRQSVSVNGLCLKVNHFDVNCENEPLLDITCHKRMTIVLLYKIYADWKELFFSKISSPYGFIGNKTINFLIMLNGPWDEIRFFFHSYTFYVKIG